MLQRITMFIAIVAVAYWYWSGPYQEKTHPSYDTILEENDRKMAECTRAAAYAFGATGKGVNVDAARAQCAEEFNLYEADGRWHSYDRARPD